MTARFLATAVLGFAALGCASELPAPDPELTRCGESRSPMCTREYRPVCGERTDGGRATYGNACTACADVEVVGHRDGACPEP